MSPAVSANGQFAGYSLLFMFTLLMSDFNVINFIILGKLEQLESAHL